MLHGVGDMEKVRDHLAGTAKVFKGLLQRECGLTVASSGIESLLWSETFAFLRVPPSLEGISTEFVRAVRY